MGTAGFKKPPFALDRSRRGDLAVQLTGAMRNAIEQADVRNRQGETR